jgi:hypothetical protein
MTKKMILTMCLLMVSGCGLIGHKGVSKEQINADLADKTVKVAGLDGKWLFYNKSERCFSVNDDESKLTDSSADVSITVSSWHESASVFFTVFGKMMLHYKMDGGKWVLQNIEPKELIQTGFSEQEKFKKFLEITTPQCQYFRHTNYR